MTKYHFYKSTSFPLKLMEPDIDDYQHFNIYYNYFLINNRIYEFLLLSNFINIKKSNIIIVKLVIIN